jgi:hypothetical protein
MSWPKSPFFIITLEINLRTVWFMMNLDLFTLPSIESSACDFRLQSLKRTVFRSSTESSHLMADLRTRRVPSGLCRVNFLQGFCSCILKSCPSHLNRPTFITLNKQSVIKTVVFWDVTPYRLIDRYQHFEKYLLPLSSG